MTAFVGANVSNQYAATVGPDTGQVFGLGDRYTDYQGNNYVFVSASTSITSYQVCAVTSSFWAAPITTALASANPAVGVAGVNGISSGSWGWVQTRGNMTIQVLSTASASSWLYTTGTAGALDDTSTSQVKISGIQLNSNATTVGSYAAFAGVDLFAAL